MNKKHIITIAGRLGSGKSSTANKIAEKLDYHRFSSGDFMRSIAEKHTVTLQELSEMAERDPSIDHEIDGEVKNAGEKDNLVIDSRLAFHWIPESFKVYLYLRPEIAADRILLDAQDNPNRYAEGYASLTKESVTESITTRLESEKKRYKALYNIDHTNPENFDLIIDTEKNNLDEVVEIILEKYQSWLQE
ncbi:MAG: cytidylate kinase family protein [Candidatus Pacebacteria bacterium]|nr:cytidylate kinase family protein [Candidatus Paceibacterota bacterium]